MSKKPETAEDVMEDALRTIILVAFFAVLFIAWLVFS